MHNSERRIGGVDLRPAVGDARNSLEQLLDLLADIAATNGAAESERGLTDAA